MERGGEVGGTDPNVTVTVEVLCWGSGAHGQHGHGARLESGGASSERSGAHVDAPVHAADAALRFVHQKRRLTGGDAGSSPVDTSLHSRILSFSCGASHSAVLLGACDTALVGEVWPIRQIISL